MLYEQGQFGPVIPSVAPPILLEAITPSLPNPLNPRQSVGFDRAFDRRVSLLWGPPGTGKTAVLAAVVAGRLEEALRTGRPTVIAVGSSNWGAIDNLLGKVADVLDRWARTGNGRTLPSLYRLRGDHSRPPTDTRFVDVTRNSETAKRLAHLMQEPDQPMIVASTWAQLTKLANRITGGAVAQWFDLLLLDEASQVRVAPAGGYFLLLREHAHVVLAGDDRQLGPVYAFTVEARPDDDGLLDCIFTYLDRTGHVPKTKLVHNYRTNVEIADWPRIRFYEGEYEAVTPRQRLNVVLPTSRPQSWPSAVPWSDEWARLLDSDMPIIAVTYPALSYTLANPFEAQAVAALATIYWAAVGPNLDERTFFKQRLGLVTPHRAQAAMIRNLVRRPAGDFFDPQIATVDGFQGQERDVIVASYCVADKDFLRSEEKFILDPRRFNVTLTRARMKFVLFLSDSLLQHLPTDALIARHAAHLQLFVQEYCNSTIRDVELPFNEQGVLRQMHCRVRGHARL